MNIINKFILFLFIIYGNNCISQCNAISWLDDLEHSPDLAAYANTFSNSLEHSKVVLAWKSIFKSSNPNWSRAKELVQKVKLKFDDPDFATFVKQGGESPYEELGKVMNANAARVCDICPNATGGMADILKIEELLDFIDAIRLSNLPTGVKNTLMAGLKNNVHAARGRVFEAARSLATHQPGTTYGLQIPGGSSMYDSFFADLYTEWKSVLSIASAYSGSNSRLPQLLDYIGAIDLKVVDAGNQNKNAMKLIFDQRVPATSTKTAAQADMIQVLKDNRADVWSRMNASLRQDLNLPINGPPATLTDAKITEFVEAIVDVKPLDFP